MLEVGSVIGGKYKILYKVGHGGMSNVYLAINERANKEWAVKEIDKNRDDVRQEPETETSIMKRVNHPHLPRIVDVIETEDTYLILMDYIEGKTLKKILNDKGAQPQEKVVDWALQLCDVLEYLHSLDPPIVYRDMKPDNIMLKPNGDVVLIDFGIAREYKEGAASDTKPLGTVGYAAPEQYGGEGQSDARTDVYTLGATMYHLVTGKNPTKPPYEMRPIRKWDPNLSSGLESIIIKCTRNDPEERYQNIAQLRYALQHYRELDKSYQRQKKKTLRQVQVMAVAGAACIVLGIASIVYSGILHNDTYEQKLHAARTAVTQEAKTAAYEDAIKTDPGRAEAYEELLTDVMLSDGIFTENEAEEITRILGYRGKKDRGTIEDRFRKNKEGYDLFCYDCGLAYFYYYGDTGNKQLSRPWLLSAKESDTLDAPKKERANRLYAIADYYASLGSTNKAGDNTVSYKTYWDDMMKLSDGDIAAQDNVRTALVVYKEVAYQAGAHAKEFRDAGIDKDTMLTKLSSIERHIEDMKTTEEYKRTDNEELAETVLKNISNARQIVDTVFFS